MWELFIHWGRKQNVCKHVVEKIHNLLELIIQRDWIRLKRWKHIMSACQGVNLLLFMIKVWTNLNTALFSSSIRLTESKISRYSEIVSEISKSEKKSCCLRVVWRGQSNKKWDTVSVIPQIQFGNSARFLIKRCAFKALQITRVGGFLRVLRFPPLMKLTATI